MKKTFLIIGIFCMLCSCGIKSDPEYKSQINFKNTTQLI